MARRVVEILAAGGVVAGTSAGAAAMSDTMLVEGSNAESHRIGDLHLAPGLGLVRDVIIDQHFAERGRIGRLLGSVQARLAVVGCRACAERRVRERRRPPGACLPPYRPSHTSRRHAICASSLADILSGAGD